MEQSNHDLEGIVGNTLDQHSSSTSFNDVWNKHQKKMNRSSAKRKIFSMPLVAIITVLALFTVGFAGYQITQRRVDNTDYAFVDDSRVIGKWQSVDYVMNIEDFSPDGVNWTAGLYLTQMAFVKDGKMLASVSEGNGNLAEGVLTWTKEIIINKHEQTASKYEIREIGGSSYMFFEWKSGDYSFRGMDPGYYVLKKVDTQDYSDYQAARIEDKIDYPFVDDPEILGRWDSVDFVKNIEDFLPGVKSWLGDLYWPGFNFGPEGRIGDAGSPIGSWTKGLILNKVDLTASKYEIKEMNGDKYMFFEWKSGDYTFRGMKPYYYVMKKVE